MLMKKSFKATIEKLQERINKKAERIKEENSSRMALKKKLDTVRTSYYKSWMDELLKSMLACPNEELDIDAVSPADVLAFMKGKTPHEAVEAENVENAEAAPKEPDKEKEEKEEKKEDTQQEVKEEKKEEEEKKTDNSNPANAEEKQKAQDNRWTPPQTF